MAQHQSSRSSSQHGSSGRSHHHDNGGKWKCLFVSMKSKKVLKRNINSHKLQIPQITNTNNRTPVDPVYQPKVRQRIKWCNHQMFLHKHRHRADQALVPRRYVRHPHTRLRIHQEPHRHLRRIQTIIKAVPVRAVCHQMLFLRSCRSHYLAVIPRKCRRKIQTKSITHPRQTRLKCPRLIRCGTSTEIANTICIPSNISSNSFPAKRWTVKLWNSLKVITSNLSN